MSLKSWISSLALGAVIGGGICLIRGEWNPHVLAVFLIMTPIAWHYLPRTWPFDLICSGISSLFRARSMDQRDRDIELD